MTDKLLDQYLELRFELDIPYRRFFDPTDAEPLTIEFWNGHNWRVIMA